MLRRLFPNVYEGWLVVSASAFIITMIGASFFYGFGTIFNPVIDEFGWSVAATSFAFSLRQETSGLAAPLIGYTIDRIGSTKVLLAGIVTMSIGVLLMSYMQSLWQFYATMVIIALGTSSAGGQVGLVATASWFERRRATAMSVMTLGGGLAGLFVIFIAMLVEALGWRGALRAMATVMLIVGFVAGLNVRSRPAGHHQPLDGIQRTRSGEARDDDNLVESNQWGVPVRRAIMSRSFFWLSIALMANGFATTALIIHQIPFLETTLDVSKSAAAGTVAVFTTTSIVGRLGMGYLADHHDKRLILAISMAMSVAAIPLLTIVDSLWQAIAVLMIIAPGFGGTIPVRPAMMADYFGTRHFGMLNGISSLVMTFGAFLGPLVVGFIVDETGAYTWGWIVAGAIGALAIPAMLAATEPRALIEEFRDQPQGSP